LIGYGNQVNLGLRDLVRTKIVAETDERIRDSLSSLLVSIGRWQIRESSPPQEFIDDLRALVSADVLRSNLIDRARIEADRVSLFLESRSIPGRIRRLCLGSLRIATWLGLASSFLIGSLFISAAYLFGTRISDYASMPIGAVITLMLSGFLGSSVSIAMKTESLPDNALIDAADVYLSTLVRPVIGSLFALLLYSLLATGLIKIGNWTVPTDQASLGYAWWLIGFISGFSERLVPDIIKRTETMLSTDSERRTATPIKS
jgi:hypothetical protein